MTPPSSTPGPLYAMYIQATRLRNGSTARRQWIVLPPLTEMVSRQALNPDGTPPGTDSRLLKFYREQSSPQNRVKWRWDYMRADVAQQLVSNEIKTLLSQNENLPEANRWNISPVITCQVTARELVTLVQDPKTPYQLLERFTKVAKTKHNLAI